MVFLYAKTILLFDTPHKRLTDQWFNEFFCLDLVYLSKFKTNEKTSFNFGFFNLIKRILSKTCVAIVC